MPKCVRCGNKGWLLAVNSVEICDNCVAILSIEAKRHLEILAESMMLVKNAKTLGTAVSRYELSLKKIDELRSLELLGVKLLEMTADEMTEQCHLEFDEYLLQALIGLVSEAESKAAVAATDKTKVTILNKALMKFQEYRAKANKPDQLEDIETSLKTKIHETQLQSFVETARKAEFKGQKKKALDQYYEALYFLRNDDIEDSLQSSMISEIVTKIEGLGGEVRE